MCSHCRGVGGRSAIPGSASGGSRGKLATHIDADAQETASKPSIGEPNGPGIVRFVHAAGPPPGSLVVRICPPPSTVTQNDADGHETANGGLIAVAVNVLPPPAGFVETYKLSKSFVSAKQTNADGQVIVSTDRPGIRDTCHGP